MPFNDSGEGSFGKTSCDNSRFNLNGNFKFAVVGVKMRRGMVTIMHSNDDLFRLE